LDVGFALLENGNSSLDAVEQAIIILENNELFNAGRGSVYTSEQKQEMDASIMFGKNQDAGAVAGVATVKNPISLARYVMEQTKHVMFSGEGAEELARAAGQTIVDPSYFYSEEKLERLRKQKKDDKMGTVGVVAIDVNGNISAGTSTGGMSNKLPGRIGDAPIIGAGTWAENGGCGVSGTGHGEFFIRFNVAKEICDRVKYKGLSIVDAANQVIYELKNIEADGGVIVLNQDGQVAMEFNTPAMARAYRHSNGTKEVKIYRDQ
jgi:beta-aspartyl-peptidase (threonine type)